MNGTILQMEREGARLQELIALRKRLEEISVPAAARLLKKDVEWVRETFPLIVHGPKSHHIRLRDIEEYQNKRTLRP